MFTCGMLKDELMLDVIIWDIEFEVLVFLSNSYDVESFLIIVNSEHLEGDKLPLVVRLFMREKSFNSCFILSMHDASIIRLLNL